LDELGKQFNILVLTLSEAYAMKNHDNKGAVEECSKKYVWKKYSFANNYISEAWCDIGSLPT
jgi:hypothetical protein